MEYKIEFLPQVYDDIKVAYDWYEEQRVGLGEDFLLTLEASYAQLSRIPKAYEVLYRSIRRKLIRRFPYGIFFIIENKKIIVIAIMHTKRKSSEWTQRA
jgi:plasmid stabilization system protein ParE